MAPAALRTALPLMDAVDLQEVFAHRPFVLKGVPAFLRGPLRSAYRVALDEVRRAKQVGDEIRRERAWKVFLLVSRMLLYREASERRILKEEFAERFERFFSGQ